MTVCTKARNRKPVKEIRRVMKKAARTSKFDRHLEARERPDGVDIVLKELDVDLTHVTTICYVANVIGDQFCAVGKTRHVKAELWQLREIPSQRFQKLTC